MEAGERLSFASTPSRAVAGPRRVLPASHAMVETVETTSEAVGFRVNRLRKNHDSLNPTASSEVRNGVSEGFTRTQQRFFAAFYPAPPSPGVFSTACQWE